MTNDRENILPPDDELGQPFVIDNHLFPGVWRYLFPPEFAEVRLPAEPKTTCDDCPKVVEVGFLPDVRCCSYLPKVPNFLLGLSLSSAARPVVAERIRKGYVLPEGVILTPGQLEKSTDLAVQENYGLSESVVCPFLDRQARSCRIYPFRNSICSTFFCKNQHGAGGEYFWEKVQEFGSQMEIATAQWCLEHVGFDVKKLMRTLGDISDRLSDAYDHQTHAWSEQVRRELFGEWFGKEIELFSACARAVRDHRHELYELARKQKIVESQKFERAMYEQLSNEQQGELDESYGATGEPAPVEDLWYKVQVANRGLWQLPIGEMVQLNPHLVIRENEQQTEFEKFNGNEPYILEIAEQVGACSSTWREFIDRDSKLLLDSFREPRGLDESLFDSHLVKQLDNPQEVLATWLRKSILIVPPAG